MEKYWVLSESRESVFKVSPHSPHERASSEVPAKDLGPRPQVKRSRNKDSLGSNANKQKA